jgi:hypothetical protein
MKAGDQIITCQNDLARSAATGIIFAIRPGQRGEVVDMMPPLYKGSARVKFQNEPGEFYVLYESICLAPGYRSGATSPDLPA